MSTIASSNIPTPKSWVEFESIVLATSKIRWKSVNFFGNGRQGQQQHGVDVYGTSTTGQSIGVQCKNTVNGLTLGVIKEEIENASDFTPKLDALYIATTAPRDARIQEAVRVISKARIAASEFSVDLLFWEDVSNDLALDEQEFFKHYPQFAPKRQLRKEHDQRLYDQLIAVLATDGVIAFLDQFNMGGFAFVDTKLQPLREFYYEWNRVDREFISPELEATRKLLWAKSDAYLEIIATETYSFGPTAGLRSVPQEMELDEPERFAEVVGSLHELAREIVELHRSLVRHARHYFVEES